MFGKGMNYEGAYFDSLKDEYSEATITLIVPALIRVNLEPQQVIECSAYLTKKVQLKGARIGLQVNVMEVHSQKQSKLTGEQIKSYEGTIWGHFFQSNFDAAYCYTRTRVRRK